MRRHLHWLLAATFVASATPAHSAAAQASVEERELVLKAERSRSVQALLRLARLQSERKDAAGALESLRRALALAPNSEDVLSAYAQLSLATHAPMAALPALEPLTRMHPTVGQYHYLLGVALMQLGDMPAAAEALGRAEQLEPDRVLTLVALGIALNNRKRYAEAKPYLTHGLELEPDSVEATAALAESEEGAGELAEAEAHARRVLARQENHATANLVLGLVLMKQERFAEARQALEKALAADPEQARTHYQLSLACARLGDDDASRAHLEAYRRQLREVEERVEALRQQTGRAPGGMQP